MRSERAQLGGGAPVRTPLFMLLLVSAPAFAQLDGVAPKELAEGLAHSLPTALAWCCVVLLLMLVGTNVFWVRAYFRQTDERILALQQYSQQQNETQAGVITLGLKQQEGLEIIDRVMDHMNLSRQSPN